MIPKAFWLQLDELAHLLVPVSLLYLALPYAIFFVGWLRWYWALIAILLLAVPFLQFIHAGQTANEKKQGPPANSGLGLTSLVLVLLVSGVLVALSGIGGFGFQDPDWLKHNSVLKDLVEQDWPVAYRMDGGSIPLVYYIAFYLPGALIGKVGGWLVANEALLVWGWIGLVLSILWFIVLVGRAAWSVVLFFVAFSGLDVIGEWLVTPQVVAIRPEYQSVVSWDHIERWAIGFEYSSNITQLFWVPNQALVGWIATAIIVYGILNPSRRGYSLFLFSLTALWSPLVMIGLVPFLLAAFLSDEGTWVERLKRHWTIANLCGLGVLAIVGLYYGAKVLLISRLPAGGIPQGFIFSVVPDTQGRLITAALLILFDLLEFGLYAIVLYFGRANWSSKSTILFMTALAGLLLIPLYRYGAANDFVMRASIPALFVLAILLGRAVHDASMTTFRRATLAALLFVGSVTGVIEVRRHITNIANAGTLIQTPRVEQVMTLWDYSTQAYDSASFRNSVVLQYVGTAESPFFELMAKSR